MSCLRALSRQVAGAGAGDVSWLRTWCVQGAGAELACLCSVLAPASDSEVRTTAASDKEAPAVMGRMNLCVQHHTVLSLERSLSHYSAVGYLHSSGFKVCFGRQLRQGLYCVRAYFCT